jgi:hypothetical protein
LEAEKEELNKDLHLAESKSNEKRDETKTEVLGELLEDKDSIQNEIKQAKDQGKELDAKLLEWEKKVRHKRKEIGGANAGSQFAANSKKQEKVFENRLDTALKRFNVILTQNASMRDEIDNLRVERNRFEELHKKLEKEYEELRQERGSVVENSTSAYDQREESQAKMVLMRDKEDKDKQQLNTELKELIRVIDHDKKLKEFMKIKTQERQEDEELVTWRRKKESEANEKRRKEREEHSVEAYEVKFREIEQITGEHDLNKLVDRFIQGLHNFVVLFLFFLCIHLFSPKFFSIFSAENKNYALFNYVNELNNQVELLQEQIDQVN